MLIITLFCFVHFTFPKLKEQGKKHKGRQLVELDKRFFQVTILIVKGHMNYF